MLNVKASIEDRKSLMGHKTNSEIYSNYHSAVSTVHVQELFRDVRLIEHATMHGLSLNMMRNLPQTISPKGYEKVNQDPELVQFNLEASQLTEALCELYGSTAAAIRSGDPRASALLAAVSRVQNRRRVLLRHVYQEEYRGHFAGPTLPQAPPTAAADPPTPMMSVVFDGQVESDRRLNTNDDIIAATSDALDWVERLEHEEESAENLGDYETIMAGDSWSHKTRIEASDSPDLDLSAADKTVQTPLDSHTTDAIQLSEASNANAALRLHGINDGSARPKNMTITRVRDVMSSGGLPDATLSQIMVEVFSATHNPGKYIPGEEPLLGTSICRFSGLDLSSDTHSPETVHRAHLKVLQRSPNDLFNSHLLPLDTPCTYYSQGPTKKKSPKLCGYYTINTRYQQIQHVAGHVLRGNRLGHESGYIPDGEWHCFYEGCAVLTTIPSTKRGVVAKVLLSTTSVFLSKRVFLRHVYQVHRLSALAIESVVWCGICERFLEWDQFAAGTDEHFEMHWDEVWKLVADHGYTGQFDNGRRTIPSFCPFCLYDESLSPTERISTSMNFIDRSGFSKYIGMHLDNIDSGPIHGCPCFPKTCLHQGKMTPAELDVHLSEVHGIHRYPSSRADRNGNTKNGKILSEKPVNIQARPSKKHKWPQAPTHTMSAVDQ
jgi:hypothetical protein